MISALLLALLAQVPTNPRTTATAGKQAPYAFSIQGVTGGVAVPISGTVNTAGAADTVGATATYNANSVCAFVATAGQTGAGFVIQAGTLAATLTPSVSTDSTNGTNGTWTNTSFVDISGNKTSTQVLTNPNSAAAFGLVLEAGVRYARVCTTAYTSGSAMGNLVASTPQPPPPAAGADVTDRWTRQLGQVDLARVLGGAMAATNPVWAELTDGTSGYVGAKTGQLPAALDGSGFLKVHEQGTATVSGTVTANAGTNLNTSALALDTSVNGLLLSQGSTTSGQKGPLLQGAVTTSAPSYTTAQTSPLSLDASGNLRTSVNNTVTVSGTVTTTPPSNASTNVTQFGGNAVATGTGASGTGIPRVTVSNDSKVLLWDSTNTAAVKAASTAPATTDPALVVTQSPNVSEQCPNVIAISQTASTDLYTSTAKVHICAMLIVSSTAQSVSLTEGTGTTCATGAAALMGSTTVANGMALAANGGWSMASAQPFLKSKTTADHLCLLQSSTGQVSGFITYADQ